MRSADAKTRDKLKDIRERLQAKRAERSRLRSERDAARDAFGEADFANDTDITSTREFQEVERIVAAEGTCADEISNLENAEQAILKLLGSDEPASRSGNGHTGAEPDPNRGFGWDGKSMLRESESYREAVESGVFHSDVHFGTVVLGKVCERDDFANFASGRMAQLPAATPNAVGTNQVMVRPDFRGLQSFTLQPLSLLDLIPTGVTDSNIVQYVQVTAVPGSAAEVAEMAIKPQEGIDFADATAPVRTIAGWIKMARQAMDDMAGLATLVNTLLPYDVRRRVENQILLGDGVGQNILGLLNTSGIGAPAAVAGDTAMDRVLRAITTVVLSDGDPNFIAMNPLTFQDMAIAKNAGGDYLMEMPGGIESWAGSLGAGRPTLWGLAITRSRLISQTAPIVGDANGATLLVREGVNVKTSDADQDDFIRNRVTVLAETRVAFPVWRPGFFARVPAPLP
jgi:hypothetical protein